MKLHLHVMVCYFAEIKAGTKREEYREQNAFWKRKLFEDVGEVGEMQLRKYDGIVIYNAYIPGPENCIEFPWRGFTNLVINHPHFGNRNTHVYAIKLEP